MRGPRLKKDLGGIPGPDSISTQFRETKSNHLARGLNHHNGTKVQEVKGAIGTKWR